MSKNKKPVAPKQRNPLAMATRMMGKRVVADKTKYTRKQKHKSKDY